MFCNGYKHVFLQVFQLFRMYGASVYLNVAKVDLCPNIRVLDVLFFLFHWREPRALSQRFRLKMHEKIKPKHKIGSSLNPSLPLLPDLFPMQTKKHLNKQKQDRF
jgi:hypothetical protein